MCNDPNGQVLNVKYSLFPFSSMQSFNRNWICSFMHHRFIHNKLLKIMRIDPPAYAFIRHWTTHLILQMHGKKLEKTVKIDRNQIGNTSEI